MITKFRTYKQMPSKYLTKEIFESMLSGNKIDLIDIMFKDEAKQKITYISEGLSKTYPTSKFIEWYYKYASEKLPHSLQNITYSIFDNKSRYFDKDVLKDTPIFKIAYYIGRNNCQYYLSNPCDNSTVYNTVVLLIPAYKDMDFRQDFLNMLIDNSFIYGYNLSHIEKNKTLNENIVVYKVQFEAKFPVTSFKLNENLYHITFFSNLEKIKKHGLIPKSNSFLFDYPDRIYLFNSEDSQLMINYFMQKISNVKQTNTKFCIIKIKKSSILNSHLYKNGNLTFYIDSYFNYADNAEAIFTYNGIPANLIDNTCLVYDKNNKDWMSNPTSLKFK
jgi:hypothetical protein